MSKLTFDVLRLANKTRLPLFKNSKGELAHNTTGSDWSPLEWAGAMSGEVGEVIEAVLEFAARATKIGDTMKKIRRGDIEPGIVGQHCAVMKELADVQIYLDLLAMQLGIDLGAATVLKFNEVSRRVGAAVFITCDDPDENEYGSVRVERRDPIPPTPGNYAAERAAGFNSCDADNMVRHVALDDATYGRNG